MSYAVSSECCKCKQLIINSSKLPCGRVLCNDCGARWTCSCTICSDNSKDTFVPRKGLCKICFSQSFPPESDMCTKCQFNYNIRESNQSESIWDFLWSLGSKFSCRSLFVPEQSKDEFEDKYQEPEVKNLPTINQVKFVKGPVSLDDAINILKVQPNKPNPQSRFKDDQSEIFMHNLKHK